LKGIKIDYCLVFRLAKKANIPQQCGLLVDTITSNLKAAYKDYEGLKKQVTALGDMFLECLANVQA